MASYENQYPVNQSKEHSLNRKQFGFALVIGIISGGLAQLFGSSKYVHNKLYPDCKEKVLVGTTESFNIGESVVVQLPPDNHPVLVIRKSESNIKAFSQKCTHLLCPVHYSKEKNSIICPCHKGVFDSETGEAIAGPPDKPLPSYQVQLDGNQIYLTPDVDNKSNHV